MKRDFFREIDMFRAHFDPFRTFTSQKRFEVEAIRSAGLAKQDALFNQMSSAKALTQTPFKDSLREALNGVAMVARVSGANDLGSLNNTGRAIIKTALASDSVKNTVASAFGIPSKGLKLRAEIKAVLELERVAARLPHKDLWSGFALPGGVVPAASYVGNLDVRRLLDSQFERTAAVKVAGQIVGALRSLSHDFETAREARRTRQGLTSRAKSREAARESTDDPYEERSSSTDAFVPNLDNADGQILVVRGDYSPTAEYHGERKVIGSVPIFIGNAYRDSWLRDELVNHLTSLRVRELIRIVGEKDMSLARVVVLLISADYLSYVYGTGIHKEMEDLKRRCEVSFVPVFLSEVVVEGTFIAPLKRLPSNGIEVVRWTHRDSALADVARGLEELVDQIRVEGRGGRLKH